MYLESKMEFKHQYFISPIHLQNHRQLFGDEAILKLREMGLTFIHVDDSGAIQALNQDNQVIQGYYLYEKEIPVIN